MTPIATVVMDSSQYLTDEDRDALIIATYQTVRKREQQTHACEASEFADNDGG